MSSWLVPSADGGFAVLDSTSSNVDIKGNNTTLTAATTLEVKAYIYYDGDESVVYTNNKANLVGADMRLTFDVDAIAAP